MSGVHRRTKPLKKLDMSRCQLSQNGFYELIPIILKSEHVILQVKLLLSIKSYLRLFSTHPGQPDHPTRVEDIFWPAEVIIILPNHHQHYLFIGTNLQIDTSTEVLCIEFNCKTTFKNLQRLHKLTWWSTNASSITPKIIQIDQTVLM